MNKKIMLAFSLFCGIATFVSAQKQPQMTAEIPGKPTDPQRKLNTFVPSWPKGTGKAFAGSLPAVTDVKNIDDSSTVQLTLPKIVYAMTGSETRIYFKNLVCTYDKSILRYHVDCKVGTSNGKYWAFTPEKPGDYPLSIIVKDTKGRVVGTAETIVKAASANKGNDRNAVVLIIGDSIMAGAVIADYFQEGVKKRGNPNIRLMGSHSGRGRQLKIGKAAVEAYGGWTWGAFMSIWKSGDGYGSKTKFMKKVNGKLEFAIQEYLDKYNGGKAPDIVVIYLGCNDVASAKMNDIERLTNNSMRNRDRFLAALQKAMPNTLFGIALLAPANSRAEAFERNYKGMIPKQQYDYNQFSYIRRMQKDLQNCKNVSLIPFYVGVDDVEDYPQFNAVHPHAVGQKRLAMMLEMWFKNVIQ